MGSAGSKEGTQAAVSSSRVGKDISASNEHLFNAKDLRNALDTILNLGQKPENQGVGRNAPYRIFQLPFYCKEILWDSWLSSYQNEQIRSFLSSDVSKRVSTSLLKSLDADGDGKLSPNDLQILYDRHLTRVLKENQSTLDQWLPFVGQCFVGLGVGYGIGGLTRYFYRRKFWIAGAGLFAYSALQYLAQQNFINKQVLESAFKKKIQELADTNGDGVIDRADLHTLIENRMEYLVTKLGPGGIAPGAAGYASLALGFAKGIRFF